MAFAEQVKDVLFSVHVYIFVIVNFVNEGKTSKITIIRGNICKQRLCHYPNSANDLT